MTPIGPPSLVVSVAIIDPDDSRDLEPTGGDYFWANARNKQLVPLPRITMQELVDGVRARIPDGRVVLAIYGTLSMPPTNGQKPADTERVTTDADFKNVIAVAGGAYKPLLFQLQLARGDRANESPPPDNRQYFAENEFVPVEDPYHRVASDSDNELYLIKFGRKKAKEWPRSDHGFESEKARCRRKLEEFRLHLEDVKGCHRAFKGPNKQWDIIDSDNENLFGWIRYLNPQSGKGYVKARAADRYAARAETDEEARGRAVAKFEGEPEEGDYNLWLEVDEREVENESEDADDEEEEESSSE